MYLLPEVLVAATGCSRGTSILVAPALEKTMNEFDVNTPLRAAHFVAQLAYESTAFTRTEENLNYSLPGLVSIFPHYFAPTPGMPDASLFAHQPAKIANHVYALRMGNGDEASGDGFRFRGRGYIQLTGKLNYTACGAALAMDLLTTQDWLTTPEGAADVSGWFWSSRDINGAADTNSITAVTRLINPRMIGLPGRTALTQRALAAFGVTN